MTEPSPSLPPPSPLTLEQQFNVRSFETQVRQMSREQAQDFLIDLYKQMLQREVAYKELLKNSWFGGIGNL